MKKLIALILSLICIMSAISFSAFAESNDTVTLSDDFQSFEYFGETYVRINSTEVDMNDVNIEDGVKVELNETQRESIKKAEVYLNTKKTLASVSLTFIDGAYFTADFMKEDCLPIYEKYSGDDVEEYEICINNIYYDEGVATLAKKSELRGKKTTLTLGDFYESSDFEIVAGSRKENIYFYKGKLLIFSDKFYFIENELLSEEVKEAIDYYGEIDTSVSFPAWEITNPALLEKLKQATDEYYGESWGVYYTDNETEIMALLFIVSVLLLLPIGVFVVFLILFKHSRKRIYRKLCLTVSIAAIFEILVLISLIVMHFVCK